MKLLLIFAAILAFSLAEEESKKDLVEDSEAEASAAVELLKEAADLKTSASSYNAYVPPSQRPPHWNAPNYVQPSVPPHNTWNPPQEPVKPIQPVQTSVPANVQNDYYPQAPNYNQWNKPIYHPAPITTTTPVAVIKDERYYGENGYYKYEYQIADGTHVGEEGYYTDPKQSEESLVKKGWYSFVGADGKTYTVTYWADKSGYHAFGSHLPTPPPVPAAIQAALDKEKETQTQAPIYYPTQTPAPVYYPTTAPVYYPSHHHTYPQQYPNYNQQQWTYPQKPTYNNYA